MSKYNGIFGMKKVGIGSHEPEVLRCICPPCLVSQSRFTLYFTLIIIITKWRNYWSIVYIIWFTTYLQYYLTIFNVLCVVSMNKNIITWVFLYFLYYTSIVKYFRIVCYTLSSHWWWFKHNYETITTLLNNTKILKIL